MDRSVTQDARRATVIPMPSRRSVPTSPQDAMHAELLGAAAYALASLNGEVWERVSAARLQEYRDWAAFAAACAQPGGLLRAAYAMTKEFDREGFANWTSDARQQAAVQMIIALNGARFGAAGITNPGSAAAIDALMDRDAAHTLAKEGRY